MAADKFGGVEKEEKEEEEEEKLAIWRPTLLSEGAWVKKMGQLGSPKPPFFSLDKKIDFTNNIYLG